MVIKTEYMLIGIAACVSIILIWRKIKNKNKGQQEQEEQEEQGEQGEQKQQQTRQLQHPQQMNDHQKQALENLKDEVRASTQQSAQFALTAFRVARKSAEGKCEVQEFSSGVALGQNQSVKSKQIIEFMHNCKVSAKFKQVLIFLTPKTAAARVSCKILDDGEDSEVNCVEIRKITAFPVAPHKEENAPKPEDQAKFLQHYAEYFAAFGKAFFFPNNNRFVFDAAQKEPVVAVQHSPQELESIGEELLNGDLKTFSNLINAYSVQFLARPQEPAAGGNVELFTKCVYGRTLALACSQLIMDEFQSENFLTKSIAIWWQDKLGTTNFALTNSSKHGDSLPVLQAFIMPTATGNLEPDQYCACAEDVPKTMLRITEISNKHAFSRAKLQKLISALGTQLGAAATTGLQKIADSVLKQPQKNATIKVKFLCVNDKTQTFNLIGGEGNVYIDCKLREGVEIWYEDVQALHPAKAAAGQQLLPDGIVLVPRVEYIENKQYFYLQNSPQASIKLDPEFATNIYNQEFDAMYTIGEICKQETVQPNRFACLVSRKIDFSASTNTHSPAFVCYCDEQPDSKTSQRHTPTADLAADCFYKLNNIQAKLLSTKTKETPLININCGILGSNILIEQGLRGIEEGTKLYPAAVLAFTEIRKNKTIKNHAIFIQSTAGNYQIKQKSQSGLPEYVRVQWPLYSALFYDIYSLDRDKGIILIPYDPPNLQPGDTTKIEFILGEPGNIVKIFDKLSATSASTSASAPTYKGPEGDVLLQKLNLDKKLQDRLMSMIDMVTSASKTNLINGVGMVVQGEQQEEFYALNYSLLNSPVYNYFAKKWQSLQTNLIGIILIGLAQQFVNGRIINLLLTVAEYSLGQLALGFFGGILGFPVVGGTALVLIGSIAMFFVNQIIIRKYQEYFGQATNRIIQSSWRSTNTAWKYLKRQYYKVRPPKSDEKNDA